MYISQDPIRLFGGNNIYGYVCNTSGWVDIFGLAKKHHNALWEHQNSDGTIKDSGSMTSGGTGKSTPTWAEQAASHTEIKNLNTTSISKNVKSGDKIIIVGEKRPCNGNAKELGTMGCQKAMKDFAQANNVTISYYSLEDDSVYIFQKDKKPLKKSCNE